VTVSLRHRLTKYGLLGIVLASYAFLYLPIVHITLAAFSKNSNFPYPPIWSVASFFRLASNTVYQGALLNSLLIGVATGVLSTIIAMYAAIGVIRYAGRRALLFALFFSAPLFIAEILLGISTMALYFVLFDMSGNLVAAILANTVHCFSFAFLIVGAQLYRHDWRMGEAAFVLGAGPIRTFFEVTLPLVWPSLLGAFLVSFIMSFNNLDISFYVLGATPTLPSVAWGALRYGIKPELFALATTVNGVIALLMGLMFALMRTGMMKFGYRPERE